MEKRLQNPTKIPLDSWWPFNRDHPFTTTMVFLTLLTSLRVEAKVACTEKYQNNKIRFAVFDEKAANGKCLYQIPPSNHQLTTHLLNKIGIKTSGNGSIGEMHALAEAFHAIDSIGDGRFKFHQGVSIRYEDHWWKTENGTRVKKWTSTCLAKKNQILLRSSGCQSRLSMSPTRDLFKGRNNPARIVHEWGHCLGHMKKNKQSIYDLYKKTVPNSAPCAPTVYSSKSYKAETFRNEEFAEVFSLYITHPEALRRPGCDRAFLFFAQLFGEHIPKKDIHKISCKSRSTLLTKLAPPSTKADPLKGKL